MDVESRTPAKNVLAIFDSIIFSLHSFFFILSFFEEIEQIELDGIIKEEGNYNSSKWNH